MVKLFLVLDNSNESVLSDYDDDDEDESDFSFYTIITFFFTEPLSLIVFLDTFKLELILIVFLHTDNSSDF